MKIVAEYDIKMAVDLRPVSIYKMPQVEKNLRIEEVRYKQHAKSLEMDMTLPGRRMQKPRTDMSRITYESPGYAPQAVHWYGKIVHDRRIVVLRKVDCIYLFSPRFRHLESEDREQSVDGYQFRKAESREEQEHRRRNINFHIKRMEQEEFVALRCVEREMGIECRDIQDTGPAGEAADCARMVERAVFNAKVVNFSELVAQYRDEEAVRAALSRCTVFRHGRYILSNGFYEKCLHDVRDGILDLFDEKDRILERDVERFVRNEHFLMEELCRREGRYWCLKGFYECPGGEEMEISRIGSAIEKLQPCSVAAVHLETQIDEDFIRTNAPRANAVELANGLLVVYRGCRARKKIIELLMKKSVWKKAEIAKIAQGEDFGDEFLGILGEYCSLQGAVWTIRE